MLIKCIKMEVINRVLSLWITLILSLGLLTPAAEGFLNVFIDQHEMVKLMGRLQLLHFLLQYKLNNDSKEFK